MFLFLIFLCVLLLMSSFHLFVFVFCLLVGCVFSTPSQTRVAHEVEYLGFLVADPNLGPFCCFCLSHFTKPSLLTHLFPVNSSA